MVNTTVTPPVSVVMPVYNGERYLNEAITSILKQSMVDFEFIIVDDGSTDNTSKIIHSFHDRRLVYIHQANAGIAAALNKGINLAQGDYIARMDADDIAHFDRLQLQYQHMLIHDHVDILGGQAYLIDHRGERIGQKLKPIASKALKNAIEYACPVIHPTYFVRKPIYLELGGYRTDFPPAEDYDFLLRAFDAGKNLVNLNEFVLSYRVNFENCRPERDRQQMFVNRMSRRLHKQRVNTGHEDRQTLAKIKNYTVKASKHFKFANELRTMLIQQAKHRSNLLAFVYRLAVLLVSCADFELLCSTWNGFRYKRACHNN